MQPSQRDEARLARFCLFSYFCIGSAAVLVPAIMPAVLRAFRLNTAAAGLVFPANALGSLAGGWLCGIGSDRFGRRPFIAGSAGLLALGLFLTASAPCWLLFVAGFGLIGLAQGALSIAINALVLDLGSRQRGRALNALHGTYSLGATLSPLVIGWGLREAGWRGVLVGTALVWLLVGLLAPGFRYPTPSDSTTPKRAFDLRMLGEGIFVLLFAVAFIYNGVAWSLLGWIKVYLQGGGLRPGPLANSQISLFYIALTGGRFLCAHRAERWGYGRTLLLCALGATLAYPLVTFGQRPLWVTAGMLLSGLFLSGLYPTALAYGTRLFPARAGTVAGTLSVAMTLGAMLPPWWTGALAGRWGWPLAFGINYLLVAPLTGIALYLQGRERAATASRAAAPSCRP